VKQEKKKNEAEEMIKNKRTVFVGNLPVDCTAQVREWSLSAKGTKKIMTALTLRERFHLGSHTCL